jgi:exonuclease III
MLSDIRLSNKYTHNDLSNAFRHNKTNQYEPYFHSSRNNRGVGMLFRRKLQFQVLEQYRDANENILGIKTDFNGYTIWLVSIYGPNTNDYSFFRDLNQLLINNQGVPFIIGGDWNATMSFPT